MNGDEKEEAPRPRPLSTGIWTLFSWLRRSERSSSSDSVSSVGSARTAVSFDFLAPGNYDFTNTPIVLTTPLSPPTETYKKRLQDRNLRRQRDRDVTLHRKYGLFREHGSGYDGFSLPPARRPLGNTVDRPNRERRATSECLQRRAAYVPGKRRAPLPPAIASSASLPRAYKRKRPAPKPPIKNTFKDNNNIVELINNPVRMTSNSESQTKFLSEKEVLNSSKTQKCDKKVTVSKETKPRTDKNFLKHIFENRKRSSVIDTTSVRLLPSISELDKQATEIIEKNKLRQKKNLVILGDFKNSQDTTTAYEGNSWFCTSCLRKYNSSVDSCGYCISDKRHSLKTDGLTISSPRSSIYTQTNIDVESASSSRSTMNERKILKDILKEMKDSLPKKHKENKVKDVITEIPTLRIGAKVTEINNDFKSQPSSSSEVPNNKNRILSISSLLSETPKNYDQINISDKNKNLLSAEKKSDLKNLSQFKASLAFENKNNIQSNTSRISPSPKEHLCPDNDEKNKNNSHSSIILSNKIMEQTKCNKAPLNSVNIKNLSHVQSQPRLLLTNINDSKGIDKSHLQMPFQISDKNILNHRQIIAKDQIKQDNKGDDQNQVSSTSSVTNIFKKSDIIQPKSSKLHLNFPNSGAVVVNTMTVVTSDSNNKSFETQKKVSVRNTENNVYKLSNVQTETQNTDVQFPSPSEANDDLKTSLVIFPETLTYSVKPENDLHTPLNISSLLNPIYSPSNTVVKEIINKESDAGKCLPSNCKAVKTFNIDKKDQKQNKELLDKVTSSPNTTSSDLKTSYSDNNSREPQITDIVNKERTKPVTLINAVSELRHLPSTSGCSSNIKNSNSSEDPYDRRRHLINQLEQSIAKGDEVAAAEAAVKLAKLKLSCSVLSFSSQIVGESLNTKQNEKNKQDNIMATNTTSSNNKLLDQIIPQAVTAEIIEDIDINTQIERRKPVRELKDKKISEKDVVDSNESSVKPQLFTSKASSSTQLFSEDIVSITVWIEDKQAARGPIQLNISRRATVADLRRQAEHSLGLATRLQRWIVGRTLCSDDSSPIVSLAGPYLRAPFYLCIVQPDQNDKSVTNEVITDTKDNNATGQNGEFYTELMKLEKQSLVPNVEPFECSVCMEECAAGAGVILRECIHTFCRNCLSDVVQHSQEPAVPCPATGCSGFLQEREIRTIVTSEKYERWLARGLATAECGTRNAFHCRTRDCTGWAFYDPGVRRFPCPVCKNTNCVQCQAIHEGDTCEQYQTKLRQAVTAAETIKDDEGTQALLNSLIARGEALECPECRAIITKKWGCDWVKCSACKTEICWVTKGRRWGPGGRGDTSGGCRCGVDGQRCHPSCGYCH